MAAFWRSHHRQRMAGRVSSRWQRREIQATDNFLQS